MCIRDRLKGSPNGPAHKVELIQLIHNVVACIIRQSVAQVFKIANLFQVNKYKIY